MEEFEKLAEIIADIMRIDKDEIRMDSRFEEDLGCDSLDMIEIIMEIEQQFDIEIDQDELDVADFETVEKAVELIKSMN